MNLAGYYDASTSAGRSALQGGTLVGNTIINLGGGTTTKSAYSSPISSLVAGWDNTLRQRYVDQAAADTKTQIANQNAASQRQAAQMGRRAVSSPTQNINAAAAVAGAMSRAGWQADQDAFNRRMSLAQLSEQDRQYNRAIANDWNQNQQAWAQIANQQQQNSLAQQAYKYNKRNQAAQAQQYGSSMYGGYYNPYYRSSYGSSLSGSTPLNTGLTSEQATKNASSYSPVTAFGNPYSDFYIQ